MKNYFFKNFDLKPTSLLLFFISLFVFTLNGQERYSNSEIDLKIELSQKNIKQVQEKVYDFRRELDKHISDYEYRVQQQNERIKDLHTNLNIYLLIISIIIVLVGYVGYQKVRDTQKVVEKELDEIQKLKEDVKEHSEETKNDLNRITEEAEFRLNNIISKVNKGAEDFAKDAENLKKRYEALKEYSFERLEKDVEKLIKKQSSEIVSQKTMREVSKRVEEIDKIKTENEQTASDWAIKGKEARMEAKQLTDRFQKESKLKEAISFYQKSSELENNDVTLHNWGLALRDLAKLKQDEMLFREAIQKYEKSDELKSDDATTLCCWGDVLCDLAKLKQDETLFREAIQKYEKSDELESDDATILNNWGLALSNLAKLKQDETLFREAIQKYEKSVELKSDDAIIISNWGRALSDFAKLKQDKDLFKEAFDKYTKSVELGSYYYVYYHMACTYSLFDKKEDAFHYLEKYLQNYNFEISIDLINNESDFNLIKDDPKFKELLNKYLLHNL